MKNISVKITTMGLFALAALNACNVNCIKGSGNEIKEDRKVAAFSKIEVSGAYNVTLKQDSSFSINIAADDNVMKEIHTDVNGDELKIYTPKSVCTNHAVTLVIGIKNLEALTGSGATEIISEGKLNLKDLSMEFSGASKATLDMVADHVIAKGSGATELNLRGQATSNTVSLTGGGKIDALDFVVGTYDIDGTGAIECKINVLNELNVKTTGAAEIQYKGSPAHINSSKTGASSIKKIE